CRPLSSTGNRRRSCSTPIPSSISRWRTSAPSCRRHGAGSRRPPTAVPATASSRHGTAHARRAGGSSARPARCGRRSTGWPPSSVPPAVAALAAADAKTLAERLLPAEETALEVPHVTLPPPPSLPALDFPASPELPAARLPGSLDVVEASVTGAPARLNAFDQNVPGFSVTFLLLGMLLGVSLGLLDERDWGTLARLRAMPAPFAATLVAKLLARFLVGLVQMIALFAVGRLVFGVSLGPEPWALLLPTAGIVFAATAFGLVVAGMARSRDAVLPVGSIAIVTMAAAGGCWWPLELEPA